MLQSGCIVYRRIASLAVAVLLLGTLVWGQCAACPMPSQASEHDCCAPPDPGDCHSSKPSKKCNGENAVPESYVKADPGVAVAPAPLISEAPVLRVELEPVLVTETPPAAPDLYLRNSVLLV